MSIPDLTEWLQDYISATRLVFIKRLAANDTLASGAHQAGPYVPKQVFFKLFPDTESAGPVNPDAFFEAKIDSTNGLQPKGSVRGVWYNKESRDEARFTRFGGKNSVILDPESTGSIAIFSFSKKMTNGRRSCNIWVSNSLEEEGIIEQFLGPVDPGEYIFKIGGKLEEAFSGVQQLGISSCWLSPENIPKAWFSKFPTGREIISKSLELRPDDGKTIADKRLIDRRDCEYEMFRSVESAVHSDAVKAGFQNLEDFLSLAQSILQSRKSRSGNSLEYHAIEIFKEEGFIEGKDFEHNPIIDKKKPDFIFPSAELYKSSTWPATKLRMLAAKTTCKDRWRQVCNEVDRNRIPIIDLLTLQLGISENQFKEMQNSGVRLIVPKPLHKSYPSSFREKLMCLEDYILEVKSLS